METDADFVVGIQNSKGTAFLSRVVWMWSTEVDCLILLITLQKKSALNKLET